MHIGLTANPI